MKKKINPYEEVPLLEGYECTSYYYRDGSYVDCFRGPQEYNGESERSLQLRANYMIDVLESEYEIDRHIAELVICNYAEKNRLITRELAKLLACDCNLEKVIEIIANRIKNNEEELKEDIATDWLYKKDNSIGEDFMSGVFFPKEDKSI